MTNELTWLFLSIALTSILMNVILILLANRDARKPYEIELAIFLAKVDLILPTVAMIAILIKTLSGKDITILSSACQVKGPIDFIIMYLSMLLVALISFSRVSLKTQLKVTKGLKYCIIIYSIIYCILVIITGFFRKFKLLPNGIDCTPLLFSDGLSTIVVLLFGISLILCLLVTVGSYISREFRIFLGDYKDTIIPLPDRALSSFVANTSDSETCKRIMVIKTIIICFTYFILIVPACILLLLEGTIDNQYSPLISSMIDICLNSITLVNPCLLLFTHSFFIRQLKSLF